VAWDEIGAPARSRPDKGSHPRPRSAPPRRGAEVRRAATIATVNVDAASVGFKQVRDGTPPPETTATGKVTISF